MKILIIFLTYTRIVPTCKTTFIQLKIMIGDTITMKINLTSTPTEAPGPLGFMISSIGSLSLRSCTHSPFCCSSSRLPIIFLIIREIPLITSFARINYSEQVIRNASKGFFFHPKVPQYLEAGHLSECLIFFFLYLLSSDEMTGNTAAAAQRSHESSRICKKTKKKLIYYL